MPTAIDIRIKVPLRDGPDDPPVYLPPQYRRYDDVYGSGELLNLTTSELCQEMDDAGVSRGILQAEHEFGEDHEWNDRVAVLLSAHPDRFVCGWARVDPRRGMDAVRELDRAYSDLGLRGAIFEPAFLEISPTDPRCYPIYAKCVELGIPVGLHTGANFSSHGALMHERPVLIDQIACHFPELIIVCHHGGWPWPHEAAAVAWRHPNVYLEFGAIAPGYMAPGSGGGWGDIVHLMDTVLREKILFGTDWPMLRHARALQEIDKLELRDESMAAYLSGNAERLLERIL